MKEYNNLPAQYNERIHAFSIDYGIVFLSMLIVVFMYIEPGFKLLIVLFVWYLINIFPSFIKKGMTFGKYNSRIKIVNEDNSEVTIKTIHLRAFTILIFGVLSLGLYFLVAFYLLDKRQDKRSIHDLIFKTKVVYLDSHISG